MGKDYYEILGVDKKATVEEIKKAYKKLAMKYHPDKNSEPGAEDMFKRVAEAYEILSDPSKRSTFDQFGSDGLEGMGGMGGFEGFNPMDMFKNMFGMNMNSSSSTNVTPVEVSVDVTLEELYTGCSKNVSYERYTYCNPCKGKGITGSQVDCPKCNGRGNVMVRIPNGMAQMPCNNCRSSGVNPSAPKCTPCNGKGYLKEKHTLSILIPKGSSKNKAITVQNEGNDIPPEERRNSNRTPLVVSLNELSHKVFTRGTMLKELKRVDHNNLLCEISITVAESLCGFTKNISYLDKTDLSISVAEQSKHSDIIIVKSKGMPIPSTDKFGDLLIRIQVLSMELNLELRQKVWALLSTEPYNQPKKNSKGIVLYDDYRKEMLESEQKENMKSKYKQRSQHTNDDDEIDDDPVRNMMGGIPGMMGGIPGMMGGIPGMRGGGMPMGGMPMGGGAQNVQCAQQ
jgi:DnaJ-class molecular chaperone